MADVDNLYFPSSAKRQLYGNLFRSLRSYLSSFSLHVLLILVIEIY